MYDKPHLDHDITGGKMIVAGLTGGIGTGKSTVSSMFEKRGIPVLDSDTIAHEVYVPGTKEYWEIVELFGDTIVRSDGSIDRKIVGDIIFSNEMLRSRLEEITHPSIMDKMKSYIEGCRKNGEKVCIIEAALIFEKRKSVLFDCIITVTTSSETQIIRLMERDGLSRKLIEHRIGSQIPLEQKARLSDFVIDNSGSLEQTELQVERLAQLLREMEKKSI